MQADSVEFAAEERPVRGRRVGGTIGRGVAWVLLAFAVIVLPLLLGQNFSIDTTGAATFVVVGLSLHVLAGYAGQISLGHQGFLGLGALVAANVAATTTLPTDPARFAIGFVAAMAIPAAVALVLGAIALRIQGLYLALVTLVFGSVIADAFFTLGQFNGQDAGQSAIRPAFLSDPRALYLFALLVVAGAYYLDRCLMNSKSGRALEAIRESEPVAQAFGIDVVRYKLVGFAFSGALAGAAGVLFAFTAQEFSDKDFTSIAGFNKALVFIVMVVVGGLGSRIGVMVASAFFGLVDVIFANVFSALGFSNFYVDHKYYFSSVLGSLLLLQTVVLNPGGLGQVISPITRWMSGGRFREHDDTVTGVPGGTHVRP